MHKIGGGEQIGEAKRVSASITRELYEQLEKEARSTGVSLSAYIREMLRVGQAKRILDNY